MGAVGADAMDEAFASIICGRIQVQAVAKRYFRSNGAATSGRRAGLELAQKWRLVDNFMWANDYPHAEGTWPHSAEAIEREMGRLEAKNARAKILGLERGEDVQVRYRDVAASGEASEQLRTDPQIAAMLLGAPAAPLSF